MKRVLFVIFFQISLFSFGQQNEDLLSYANDIKIFDAENAVQICENILRRTNNRNCEVYEILVEANFILEAYDKAIEYIYKIKNEKCNFSSKQDLKLLVLEAEIYHILELGVYETNTLKEFENLINKTSDIDVKNNLQKELQLYQERIQSKDPIVDYQVVKSSYLESSSDNINELSYLNSLKTSGLKSLMTNDPIDFKEIFIKAFPELEDNFKKIYSQNFSLIHAQHYFDQKEYPKAIDILNNTLEELEQNSHNSHYYYKRKIINELVKNYIEIRDKRSLLEVRKIGDDVEQKIQYIEISIINKIIKNTKNKNDQEINNITQKNKNTIYILLLFSTLLIIISILIWFRYYWKERQYSEIEKYLNQLAKKTKKKESKAVTKISDEIESKIINGLEEFEKKQEFLYNNVSLAYLASKLEVNTRYLSSFLNSQLKESFSSYINRLRVEYIVGKLKSNPKYLKYKISYLSEESGYTSHSSFTIAFKAVTGMSPTKFINYLKK